MKNSTRKLTNEYCDSLDDVVVKDRYLLKEKLIQNLKKGLFGKQLIAIASLCVLLYEKDDV